VEKEVFSQDSGDATFFVESCAKKRYKHQGSVRAYFMSEHNMSVASTLISLSIAISLAACYEKAARFRSGVAAASADVTAEVDALFARWNRSDTPGAEVLVIRNGRIVLNRDYGLANIESKRPISSRTVFELASITKQFTAVAIMMLAERGKLSYDDKLSTFFPEFPPYAQRITVRQLLNHTSGLPDYEALFVASGKVSPNWPRSIHDPPDDYEPTARDALHLLEQQAKLRFEPGAKWEYSNSGYVVLGQIVEKVAGQTYRNFMREEIFKPLGMANSDVYDETRVEIQTRAASYSKDGTSYRNIDYTPVSLIYGEGNILSTLEDIYKWTRRYTETSL
jgi:CubicO group peptidase (beta-lactamase class C family)